MNHYKDYLLLRNPDLHILEKDYGFATYKYMDLGVGKAVYIEDIYVEEKYRGLYKATELSEEIQNIAKSDGCTYLLGTVNVSAPNPNDSIKVLLAHGMSVLKAENNAIWFFKPIDVV